MNRFGIRLGFFVLGGLVVLVRGFVVLGGLVIRGLVVRVVLALVVRVVFALVVRSVVPEHAEPVTIISSSVNFELPEIFFLDEIKIALTYGL